MCARLIVLFFLFLIMQKTDVHFKVFFVLQKSHMCKESKIFGTY